MNTFLRTGAQPPAIQPGGPAVLYAQPDTREARSAGATQEAPRAHRGHHHHHEQRGERSEREGSSAAYATLKVKIQETLSKLVAPTAAPADDASAEIKAKFEISGPNGTIEARLKLSVDGGSDTVSADFVSALKGFTDALFSALKTLYGSAPQKPATEASSSTVTAALASSPATTPAATTVVAVPAAAAETNATPAAPVTEAVPVATPVTDTKPAPDAAATPTPRADSRTASTISIKLLLAYNNFDSQVGPLVSQLAQPEAAKNSPLVGELLGDLATRFSQLLATSGSSAQPTLGSFLATLAQSFSPRSTEPVSVTPDPAMETVGGPAKDAPAAQAAAPRFSATVDYRQVMNYGDATASFSLHARMSGDALYAVA